MNSHQAVRLAKIYSDMDVSEWGTSDLDDIKNVLLWMAKQRPLTYTVDMLETTAQQSHAGDGATPSGADGQTLSGDSSGEAGNTNPPRA